METTKVFLIDTDETYLAPLEIEFLRKLKDAVDLTVVTEQEYLREFFSRPQEAEILVIAEELYTRDILRHGIANIFLLSENENKDATDDLSVKRIYKYTSPYNIYAQVMAASAHSNPTDSVKATETMVIAVYSPAGGVGKTTLALGISSYFAQNLRKVLFVNAEKLNTFQYYFENQTPIPAAANSDFWGNDANIFQKIRHVIRTEQFDYLPPFSATLSALNLDFGIYRTLIESARASREYDVIVVDMGSCFDNETAGMLSAANKVLMVTDQTNASIFAMNMLLKNINTSSDKYYFVCNQYSADTNDPGQSTGQIKPSFMVSEYIRKTPKIGEKSLSDLGNLADMQKVAFLLS